MAFPPQVEQWRSLVAKYFPPQLVDKALYVIQHESGGDPGAIGDNGVAQGLFQIQDGTRWAGRPDAQALRDPEVNIAYAAQQLGGASGNFGAWGEGTSYNGQRFGALGNNPYPGGGAMPTSQALNQLLAVNAQLNPLKAKLAPYTQADGATPAGGVKLQIDPATGSFVAVVTGPVDPETGLPSSKVIPIFTSQEYQQFNGLVQQYNSLYAASQASQQSPAEAIAIANQQYKTGNDAVDAENAAANYARNLSAVNSALSAAGNEYQQQSLNQNNKIKTFNAYASGHMPGEDAAIPDYYLPTSDQLFAKQLKTITANLPPVPNMPYYTSDQQNAGIGQSGYKSNVDTAIAGQNQQYQAGGDISQAITGAILPSFSSF